MCKLDVGELRVATQVAMSTSTAVTTVTSPPTLFVRGLINPPGTVRGSGSGSSRNCLTLLQRSEP